MPRLIDKHYEALSKLYLRLKGYLTSNLIIHSDEQGNLKSELDLIGIRMPYHLQEYRWVNVTDYLECDNSRIEVLIGDVKNSSKLKNVKFNDGLREHDKSISQLINWLGVYQTVEEKHIDSFRRYLNVHQMKQLKGFAFFDEDLELGRFRFKFTFFCPQLPLWNGNGFKYIHGQEIIDFIWECLNENRRIETCSRRYNFEGWNDLEKYVLFFKGDKEKVDIKKFEEYCSTLR